MSKVVSLSGDPVPEDGIEPDILQILRSALACAERGELTDVTIVALTKNDRTRNWWFTGGKGLVAMIGALDIVKHSMLRHMLEAWEPNAPEDDSA